MKKIVKILDDIIINITIQYIEREKIIEKYSEACSQDIDAYELRNVRIKNIDLSVRATKILKKMRINNLYQALQLEYKKLLARSSCGKKTADEIYYVCRNYAQHILNSSCFKDLFQEEQSPDYSIEEILSLLKDEIVTEESLKMFPLFSKKKELPLNLELHPSYRETKCIKELDFSSRALGTFSAVNINSVRELLFTTPSLLTSYRNCGALTVSDIQSRLTRFLMQYDNKSNLFDVIGQLNISKKKNNIFLDYLAFDSEKYPNFRLLGERHNITRQRAHQIVSRIIKSLTQKYRIGLLDDACQPLRNSLDRYKGVIRVDRFVRDYGHIFNMDKLLIIRYIRFWSLMPDVIVFDNTFNLYWKYGDVCVNCNHIIDDLELCSETKEEILLPISEKCKLSNCPNNNSKVFDSGQLLYHVFLRHNPAIEPD